MNNFDPAFGNSVPGSNFLDSEVRTEKILQHTTPLPGSIPYENCRQIRVSKRFDYWEVLPFLTTRFPQINQSYWEDVIQQGKLIKNNHCILLNDKLRAGNVLFHLVPNTVEPRVSNKIKMIFQDQALLVLDKPAPLPVHPSGRYNKNSLISFLHLAYPILKFRIVHRLDRDTTGVIVFAKSKEYASHLRRQFDTNIVKKTYLAHVSGVPENEIFGCSTSISSKPVSTGIREIRETGKVAYTDFKVIRVINNETSLLVVQPRTGRTNQIRLHLCSLGHPIIGDKTYPYSTSSRLGSSSIPVSMRLHASSIKVQHPISGDDVEFYANPPDWIDDLTK